MTFFDLPSCSTIEKGKSVEDKYIFKRFPPCGEDVAVAERENKVKNVQEIHLPACGFEAQQKKMQRIMGPCACTGALWDYVIHLPDVFSYISNGVCVI